MRFNDQGNLVNIIDCSINKIVKMEFCLFSGTFFFCLAGCISNDNVVLKSDGTIKYGTEKSLKPELCTLQQTQTTSK